MKDYLFPILVGLFVIAMVLIALCPSITLTNEQYDRLKELSVKWGSIATLLGIIAKACDMPYATETLTIFVGIGSCLAELLSKSNKVYKNYEYIFEQDGDIDFTDIEEDEEVEDNGITITDDEE